MFRPRDVEDVVQVLFSQSRTGDGVIARGAGRSYGDAAQNDGGDVLDMTGYDRILSIDGERRLITAQAGATIGQLMAALASRGLTLPVVPGTRHVTLAGAIASDIHGKNHHRDGCLRRHVVALSLCTPADGCLEVSPETDPELFYATLGGMGLTGVVVQATLRVEPLSSPWVAADVDRTDSLEQTLELLAGEEHHRYSVAWLDLLAYGPRFGRAVVSRADPLPAAGAPREARGLGSSRRAFPSSLSRSPVLDVPRSFPAALLAPILCARLQRASLASLSAARARAAACACAVLLSAGQPRRVEPSLRSGRPDPVPVRRSLRPGGSTHALL